MRIKIGIISFGVIWVACSDSIQDQLVEVQRLETLKEKTAEVLVTQMNLIEALKNEFTAYASNSILQLEELKRDVETAKQSLTYWENWHLDKVASDWCQDSLRVEGVLKKMQNDTRQMVRNKTSAEFNYKRLLILSKEHPEAFPDPKHSLEAASKWANRIADKKKEIEVFIKEEVMPYRTNKVKASYKTPPPQIDKIIQAKKDAEILQREHDRLSEECKLKGESYLSRIRKMEADLSATKTALDSLDAMHTDAIFALSRMK